MYNNLSKKFNELNSVHTKLQTGYFQLLETHNQKQKENMEQITKLKTMIVNSFSKGHSIANTSHTTANTSFSTTNTSYSAANTSHTTANTSKPQLQPRAQPRTPAQATPGVRNVTSPPVPSTSSQGFNWNSDEGKRIGAFFSKSKIEMNAIKNELRTTQGERETLKRRVIELTTQLETKSKADADTMTAIDKAELLEAELEDLNVRLDKCESDLEAARTELSELKSRNAELEAENESQREKLDADRSVMEDAKKSLASLHEEYQKVQSKLAQSRGALGAQDDALSSGPDTSQTSVDSPVSEKALGKQREVQPPTPADWKKSATTITTLQRAVWRLRQEKVALEKQLSELKQKLQTLEEENTALGIKLHTSADVASELSKLHIAANERSVNTENKLHAVEKELKRANELIALREREKEDLEIATRSVELARQAEFASRIKSLEAELSDLIKARDAALAQIDDWEENRGMWKRWGEAMALRAKQWQEEARKARKPRSVETNVHTKVHWKSLRHSLRLLSLPCTYHLTWEETQPILVRDLTTCLIPTSTVIAM
ncbi:autophagy-related protein 16 [Ceratobasidium sp. AG-Ba]|nr:autophagy-related protein 16 [Ceratobasidium sp. AG-Ba]